VFIEHFVDKVGLKLFCFLGCKQMKNEKKMDPRKMMRRDQGNVL
jgi:hypothetical protein